MQFTKFTILSLVASTATSGAEVLRGGRGAKAYNKTNHFMLDTIQQGEETTSKKRGRKNLRLKGERRALVGKSSSTEPSGKSLISATQWSINIDSYLVPAGQVSSPPPSSWSVDDSYLSSETKHSRSIHEW